jgi:hypothetical protein
MILPLTQVEDDAMKLVVETAGTIINTRGGRMASSYQYSFEQSVDERDTIDQILSFVMKR